MNRGSIHSEWLESRLLQGNPLGDPSTRELIVYLPPGYGHGQRRFPVIYCLAGFLGTGRNFINSYPFNPGIHLRMDRLIEQGCPEAILVFPDCFTRVGGSQYLDSSATGLYQRYLTEEIVSHVDRTFRTLDAVRHRGVMGKSSGGYGALMLGMTRPDLFGAVACHSGDMYFEYCYKRDLPGLIGALWQHGSLKRYLVQFGSLLSKGPEIPHLNLIGMAAAYSPNPNNPDLGIDLPFEPETGELVEETWGRWLEKDPVHLVDRYGEALRSLRLLYVDCGTKDEFALHIGARIFARKLRVRGIAHVHEEFDGGHTGTSYRYDVSLPALAYALV